MIEQIVIAVCGLLSVFASQSAELKVRRWACLAGICAQPFWFAATIEAGQWGMCALTVAYTLGWMRGIWIHWIRPQGVIA